MKRPSRILVPTDFGAASDVALSYGIDLARLFDASLHVLHAVVDVVPINPMPATYGVEHPGVLMNLESDGQARLHALISSRDDITMPVTEAVVRAVSPANAVLEYAADHDIDFIVMGTHGRGAVSHFLLGSVTETVVRSASCPVLTVRNTSTEPAAAVARRKRSARAKPAKSSRSRKRTVA